jgi:hypothetical protein
MRAITLSHSLRSLAPVVLGGAAATCVLVAVLVACGSDPSGDLPSPGDADGGEGGAPETGAPDAPVEVDAGPTAPGGGTRIKARYIETDDGARIFDTLYDSKLAVACSVGYAEDGALRCLPNALANVGTLYGAGCTAKVAVVGKDICDVPPYAREYLTSASPCDNKLAMHNLGAKTTAVFTKDSGGGCNAAPLDPGEDYYELGAKLAASEMVGYTMENVPASPAIGVRMFVGEDGSRDRIGQLFDIARANGCFPGTIGDDTPRCVPSAADQATSFGDSSCSTRIAVAEQCHVPQQLADTTTAIAGVAPASCQLLNRWRVFPVGAARATNNTWSMSGASGCLGPTPAPTGTFDVGAELAATAFPELAFETLPGGTRIGQKGYTSAGVPVEDRTSYTDATLGASCTFRVAADGKLRCVPTSIFVAEYTDAGCTAGLAEDLDGCEPAKYAYRNETQTCGVLVHVHAIGAKIDPPPTDRWFGSPGNCTKSGGSANAKGYYALGAEVPPATFAEGHLVLH